MTVAHQNGTSDSIETTHLSGQTLSVPITGPVLALTAVPVFPKPQTGTFYSLAHPEWLPLPFNPFPDLAVYWLAEELFVYDDRDVDYDSLQAEAQKASSIGSENDFIALNQQAVSILSDGPAEGEGTLSIARTSGGIVVSASGLQSNTQYVLLSKRDLWQQHWEAECVFTSSANGQWSKDPFEANFPQKFYQVSRPPLPIVSVECYCDTLIGSGMNGRFVIRRRNYDPNSTLIVDWTVSGTATAGTDYVALQPPTAIEPGSDNAVVEVVPWDDVQIEPPYETVVISLKPSSNYWIDARYSAATNKICTNLFIQVVRRYGGPIGIDYYLIQGNQGLLISDNCWYNGIPLNFTKIAKVNGLVDCSQWSSVSGLIEEIKVATVKSSAANFCQGDMFFGYKPSTGFTRIGRVCAGGSTADLNWAILQGETTPVHGGLYIDQTGLFNHDLIVVTGGVEAQGGTVWRITSNPDHSSGTKTLFAVIPNTHLEGVITLPNDPARYGPWAGKILTGDETHKDSSLQYEPLIYTINQQANVEEFRLGVAPEDFDVIQEGQNLYCNDADWNVIWKVPSWYFAEHVGDILVTQAGEVRGAKVLEDGYALLLILHWEAEQNRFVQKVVFHPCCGMFEHVTFAPVDL